MKPIAPRKRAIAAALIALGLFTILVFKLTPSSEALTGAPAFVPNLNATKSATQLTDINGNGIVNPGDGLRYLVTINNTGADPATGVTINDTIDANTTLVGGSVIASAIAVNESYSSIGNVGISVPDGPSDLLANDLDANNPGSSAALVIVSPPTTSAQGGQVSINTTTGAFTYNPPPGFEGADTFTYTLSNGTTLTDTATVTINVSGMIWFINNNAAACTTLAGGCGRLSNPFSTLAAFQALNNGTGNNPAANDNIFVYESATGYPGGVTLLSGQKLIGQDATATLATITGITVPTFSNPPLPSMDSGNLVFTNLTGTTTLNTNTVVRGLRINSTTNTGINDPAGAITGVSVSEIATVTTTTGTAVLLSSAGGTFSFTNITSNGAVNGISLTTTTGSFAVTGTGGTCTSVATCTGGSIQNSTGDAIFLSTAQNLTFDRLNIENAANNGIQGTGVVNFSYTNGRIHNAGTANAGQYEENAMAFVDPAVTANTISGTVTVTNNIISQPRRNGVMIETWNGTISNINVSTNTMTGGTTTANILDAIHVFSQGTATQTAHITTGTFNNNLISGFRFLSAGIFIGGNGIRVAGGSGNASNNTTATIGAAATPIQITGNDIEDVGSNSIAVSFNGQQGISHFNVSNNGTVADPMSNAEGLGISVFFGGSGTFSAAVNNNAVDNNGPTVNAGSSGIAVQLDDGPAGLANATGTANITVNNNTVTNPDGFALRGIVRASNGTLNLKMQNNNAGTPSAANRNAIRIDSGSASGNTNLCLNLSGNSGPAVSGTDQMLGSGVNSGLGVRKQGTVAGTNFFGINGITPNPTTAQVAAYLGSPVPPGLNYTGGPAANGVDIISGNAYMTCSLPFAEEPNISTDFVESSSIVNDFYSSPFDSGEFEASGNATVIERASSPTGTPKSSNESDPLLYGRVSAFVGEVASRLGEVISPTAYAQKSVGSLSGETVNKALGTLPPGENIRVQFDVTVDANIPTNDFSVANTAGITSTNHAPINSTTATTTVVHPPTLSKAFGAANIALNSTTTLTFTIGNANPGTAFTNVAFSDTLPAGMVIATPNGLVNNCGGGTITATQGTGVFSVSALARPANSTCTIVINVLGTTDGTKNNLTGTISSTQGGTGLTAAASVNVITAPSFSTAFGAATIPVNGSTSLSFTITNNSPNFALSGVGFTDTLPAGMVVATPNGQTGTCGGGTITATPGAGSVSLSGATLAASTNCTFSVNVTGTTAGVKNNTVQMTSTQLGNGATANASVTVVAPPTIGKAFGSPTILQNVGVSILTITITNPNTGTALSGVGVVDPFPSGLEVYSTPNATNTCGGTFAPSAGNTSITLTGGSIAASANCAVSVWVTGTTEGVKNNTTNNVSSTNGGNGLTASASVTVTNTATWNGSANTAWTNVSNWTPATVPGATNNVSIPTGPGLNPTLSNSVTVANITLDGGRTLTIPATTSFNATGTCVINGFVTVASTVPGALTCGTLSGTGTIAFSGAAAQNIPALTYHHLTINNAAGTTLAGNTTVNGVLTLTSGNINTGANTLTIGPGGSSSRTSGHVMGNLAKIFAATGAFTFHVGTATGYSPLATTVTALVINPSTLTVRANDGTAPATPPLNDATTLDRFWTVTETGDLTANLLFTYLQADVDGNEANYRIFRVNGGVLSVFPSIAPCPGASPRCIDTTANTIRFDGVSVFSDWTAGEAAPTAANATVSGRVYDSTGRGIAYARVSLVGSDGNPVYAMTNPFGYYRFNSVMSGEAYVVGVTHKRYMFAPRSVTVNENVTDLDFVAEPEK